MNKGFLKVFMHLCNKKARVHFFVERHLRGMLQDFSENELNHLMIANIDFIKKRV